MHAFIGLGNPGSEYDGTRHNLGFSVIDALSEELAVELKAGHGEYLIGKSSYRGRTCCLVKPLTYMNNSGVALRDLTAWHKIHLDEILVICDDFHLPLGSLRLRPSGSDGGHNGLYSVIYHLQTEKFPRLRCGIGSETMPSRNSELARFVLTVFRKNELHDVREMVARARDAALVFASSGLTDAMNKFNASTPA